MIWCLHGFLGCGADWDALGAHWPADLPGLRAPDLFASAPRRETLSAFGTRFAAQVADTDASPALVGYSLGGRLALHALLAAPDHWRAAVIVSAHLGLPTARERAARRINDAAWAARFARGRWTALIADWNARAVFGARPSGLERPESAYDRAALAAALTDWSLGRQQPLEARLAAVSAPILWVAGADDPRYLAEGERARSACPRVELTVAPGAGHRVPWEQPDWFAREAATFLRRHGVVSS